jgi:indole-3-glycerol phosphate synthase
VGFLTDAVAQVRRDLERRPPSEGTLLLRTRIAPPPLDFEAALRRPGTSLVAEVKRASPSAGEIAAVEPDGQAARYERGGAAAVSVLTEPRHFDGSLADLRLVRRAVSVPVLRKDFLIHPAQVLESRAEGADAVLLVAAALTTPELEDLRAVAEELGMAVLVEAHGPEDLARAVESGARLVGVNARDLETLEVDREGALALAAAVPPDRVLVLESGIRSREDVRRAEEAGAAAVLVGEALMRSGDPEALVRGLLGTAPSPIHAPVATRREG